MKIMLIAAAALTLGSAAIAQNTPSSGSTTGSGQMQPDRSDTTTTQPMESSTQGTAQPTDTQQQPMGDTSQPMSQPMGQQTGQPMAQPMNNGNMSNGNMSNMGAMASGTPTGEYPRCSRTVTDRCIQGPARSARRRR